MQSPYAQKVYMLLRANPQCLLAYDIETLESTAGIEDELTGNSSRRVLQIQFSVKPKWAVAVSFTKANVEIIRAIFALYNPKAGFNNWRFDDPILRAGGTTADGQDWSGFVINGRIDDTRDMWLRLQPDSPANLQYVSSFFSLSKHNIMKPWKHTSGENLARYGCQDVDVVQRIMQKLPNQMRERGCWESYDVYTRPLRPILDACQARGVPFSVEGLDQLHEQVSSQQAKVMSEIQQLVPEEIKNRSPKAGYKVVPKEIKQALVDVGVGMSATEIANAPASTDVIAVREFVREKTGHVVREFEIPSTSLANGEIGEVNNGNSRVSRWCSIEPFLPTSSKQMIGYMRYRGHKVPKVWGEDKDTTAAGELERLFTKTGDMVYRHAIDYRELLKIDSTYVEPFKQKLGSDGAVHTTFTFNAATPQLTSIEPNCQNLPKNGAIADSFRKCIVARPGHVLLRFDYRSFHARTLGLEAQDSTYMAMAAKDIHSFVAMHLLKLPDAETILSLSEADQIARLAEVKKLYGDVRDTQAKPCILGVGFGMEHRKMFNMNREFFAKEADAKKVLDTVKAIFPKIFAWQKRLRARLIPGQPGYKGPYLMSKWSFLRWFFDVAKYDFKYDKLVPGNDYNECVAYLPATDAFGLVRWNMLELELREWLERARLINTVHDDLWFECPEKLADEAIPAIWKVLERPCPVLADPVVAPGGFTCEVEAQVGYNMGKFIDEEMVRRKPELTVNTRGMQEIGRPF